MRIIIRAAGFPALNDLDTSLCMSFVEAPAAPLCCITFVSHPFKMILRILRPYDSESESPAALPDNIAKYDISY